MATNQDLRPAPGWAAQSGHSQVKPLRIDETSDAAGDRVLIAERVYRYGWGYDERNEELLGDCFTEDGVWEGSIMGQQSVGPFTGRSAITEFLMTFWVEQSDQRRHMFMNVIVDDLTPTTATAHAYLLLTGASDAAMTPVTAGPYRFTMQRDADSWRISHLFGGWDAPF